MESLNDYSVKALNLEVNTLHIYFPGWQYKSSPMSNYQLT